MAETDGLAKFLTAVREKENQPYTFRGDLQGEVTPFGAYGMWAEAWPAWSQAAGLGGQPMGDPAAQDSVAAFWAQKLFQRYGSWDMVAAAWYSGIQNTDRAASMGTGISWFKNKETIEYVKAITEKVESEQYQAVSNSTDLSAPQQQWINPNGAPRGWLDPIAGNSEYSNSFTVPRDNKDGIHGAIDVYATRGTPIVAPVGGTVLSSKSNSGKGGNWVTMKGADGLTYYFAHMEGSPVVKSGQQIQAGANIGFVGNSGSASGTKPHLHFKLTKGGKLVNPYTYLEGAKNAGNYYAPDASSQFEAPQTASSSETLDNVLSSVSDQVAGGSRQDYRNLPYYQKRTGQIPEGVEPISLTPLSEPEEHEDVKKEKPVASYRDRPAGSRQPL